MRKYVLDKDKYIFDANNKTITFTFDLLIQNILVITDVTVGEVIYNFACAGKTGTLTYRLLSLEYDTTVLSSTDDLLIILQEEDSSVSKIENIDLNTARTQSTLNNILEEIKTGNKILQKIYNPE